MMQRIIFLVFIVFCSCKKEPPAWMMTDFPELTNVLSSDVVVFMDPDPVPCSVLNGTPCEVHGYLLKHISAGTYECFAKPDLTKATAELCDGIDNNCDGVTDGESVCVIPPHTSVIKPNEWVKVDMNLDVIKNKEYLLVPDCPKGERFAAMTKTTEVFLAMLHLTSDPKDRIRHMPVAHAIGTTSINGGIVGQDYVVFDSPTNKLVDIKFICSP